jgi:hypothetical protein
VTSMATILTAPSMSIRVHARGRSGSRGSRGGGRNRAPAFPVWLEPHRPCHRCPPPPPLTRSPAPKRGVRWHAPRASGAGGATVQPRRLATRG